MLYFVYYLSLGYRGVEIIKPIGVYDAATLTKFIKNERKNVGFISNDCGGYQYQPIMINHTYDDLDMGLPLTYFETKIPNYYIIRAIQGNPNKLLKFLSDYNWS